MHILFLHQYFLSPLEPGGTRIYEFCKLLADRGHKVTVLTSFPNLMTREVPAQYKGRLFHKETIDGIEVRRSFSYSDYEGSYKKRFLFYLSFTFSSALYGLTVPKPDIIFATSPPLSVGIPGYLLSRIKRVPLVFEVRDLWPDFAVILGVLKGPRLIKIFERLEAFLYRKVNKIIVISRALKDHIAAEGVDEGKIEVVPNGINPTEYAIKTGRNEVRKSLGISDDAFIVTYAGAHNFANSLETLIEAGKHLKDRHIKILFIGDGEKKKELKSLGESYGLKNLMFIPAVPKGDIPSYLAASDLCVLTLKKIEIFETALPNKLFDYMASNRPVLTNVDGESRRALDESGAGKWVEGGNPEALSKAISQLYDDRSLLESMAGKGRAYVFENYSRLDTTAKLEKILESTANSSK